MKRSYHLLQLVGGGALGGVLLNVLLVATNSHSWVAVVLACVLVAGSFQLMKSLLDHHVLSVGLVALALVGGLLLAHTIR